MSQKFDKNNQSIDLIFRYEFFSNFSVDITNEFIFFKFEKKIYQYWKYEYNFDKFNPI